jgi:hypothetical protein
MSNACINTSTKEYKDLYEYFHKSTELEPKKIHKLNFYITSWQEQNDKPADAIPSNKELYSFQLMLSNEIENEKTLQAIPLKGSELLYKHYNLLNRRGDIKKLSNNQKTKEWLEELNQSPYYSFRLRNITDGSKRMLIFPKNNFQSKINFNEDISPKVKTEKTYTDPEVAAKVYDEVTERDIEFFMGDQALMEQEEKRDAAFNRQVYEKLDRERSQEILSKLANSFANRLGVTVNFTTKDEARKLLQGQEISYNNERAFYLNGETYFIENEFTAEDVLHEFAHPIISSIRLENKQLFDKLYDELSQTEEGRVAIQKAESLYSDFAEEARKEEAIVMFLESAANDQLQTKDSKNLLKKFLYWVKNQLRKLFDSKVNVSKLNENTTLDELADMLVNKEFIVSEKITEEDIAKYTRNAKLLQEGLESIDSANTTEQLKKLKA